MRLAGAVLALVCCVLVIRYDSRIDRAITAVIHPPPRTITWLVTVVYEAGSFGVVIVVVGLVAMTLSVSLRASGDHLRLPTLIVIIALPAILAGIAPSPGGIGVVEAGMILGLTAAGVSEADAIAAVSSSACSRRTCRPSGAVSPLSGCARGSTYEHAQAE
jgi:uncharacterized membrane protein YbhN (UPF0104 family)